MTDRFSRRSGRHKTNRLSSGPFIATGHRYRYKSAAKRAADNAKSKYLGVSSKYTLFPMHRKTELLLPVNDCWVQSCPDIFEQST